MTVREFRDVASKFMNVTIIDWDLDTFESKVLLPPVRSIDIPDYLFERTVIYMQIAEGVLCLRVLRG